LIRLPIERITVAVIWLVGNPDIGGWHVFSTMRRFVVAFVLPLSSGFI
jgi:hypothetical protein